MSQRFWKAPNGSCSRAESQRLDLIHGATTMSDPNTIDFTQVAVIGGGPGGYTAAFRAADLGMQVTVIDDSPALGGVCLNRGCIPSKALLHVARLIHEAEDAPAWGVTLGPPEIDRQKLVAWKEGIVTSLVGGIAELCRRRGIRQLTGRAVFVDNSSLRLEKAEVARLDFKRCIIATGSRPVVPAPLRIQSDKIWDSTAALDVPVIPERLLVIGGGYIGLELGTVYAALGSKVTVVELTDGLLPGADRDLVRHLQKRCESYLERILLGTKVAKLIDTGTAVQALLESEQGATEATFDRVLVATGRQPNSSGLGLESTRVQVDPQGFIAVNAQRRTDDPNIWAIGDVTGQPMLAHKASREAHVAADDMAGKPAAFDNIAIPAVVFTDPELAWCGLSETEANQRETPVHIARFPWTASGRARTLGRDDGLTKILFDPDTGRVAGVGIVGPGAGELIGEAILAVEMAAVARDLATTIHPHPTLSETMMESAEQFFGPSTHLYRQPRRNT